MYPNFARQIIHIIWANAWLHSSIFAKINLQTFIGLFNTLSRSQHLGLDCQMSPEVMYITPNIWQLGIIFISVRKMKLEQTFGVSEWPNWMSCRYHRCTYGRSRIHKVFYDAPFWSKVCKLNMQVIIFKTWGSFLFNLFFSTIQSTF